MRIACEHVPAQFFDTLETRLWDAMAEGIHTYHAWSATVTAVKAPYLAVYVFQYFGRIVIGTC